MPEIKFEVPKEIITTHVAAAVMEALGKDPEALVTAVVNEAMRQKKNSYDSDSVFLSGVKTLIREEASAVFKTWLDEKRPIIQRAITKRLRGEEGTFIETVADKLVNGLASSFYVSVSLQTKED